MDIFACSGIFQGDTRSADICEQRDVKYPYRAISRAVTADRRCRCHYGTSLLCCVHSGLNKLRHTGSDPDKACFLASLGDFVMEDSLIRYAILYRFCALFPAPAGSPAWLSVSTRTCNLYHHKSEKVFIGDTINWLDFAAESGWTDRVFRLHDRNGDARNVHRFLLTYMDELLIVCLGHTGDCSWWRTVAAHVRYLRPARVRLVIPTAWSATEAGVVIICQYRFVSQPAW